MDDSLVDVADVHSFAGDGQSLADKAGDFVTKGIPLALASGVTSVMNTGISLGNMFGDFDKIDLMQKVKDYDDDLGKYYEDHQEGVDLGGFLATSLIPGSLGVKALKALQTVKTGEGIGQTTYTLAGYFAGKQEKFLKAAAETVGSPTNLVWKMIDANKLKAVAAGFGEAALEGAVFESATLLTMNQNPVMEPGDRNYLQNIIYHAPQAVGNALLYGAVGGAIGAAGVTGKINALITSEDAKLYPHLHASLLGASDLDAGTQAAHSYAVLDDLKQTFQKMNDVAGPYRADVSADALVNPKLLKTQQATIDAYQNEFRLFVTNKLVGKDNNDIAQALLKNIDDVKGIQEHGYDIPQTELIARILGSAKRVGRIVDTDAGDLAEGFASKTANRIIKLTGEGKGTILERVYPSAGDLGKAEVKGGRLYVNGEVHEVPTTFNPVENTPTDSSNQFLVAHAAEKSPAELSAKNIPQLEAAVLKGDIYAKVNDYGGFSVRTDEILRDVKNEKISEMLQQGISHDFISRALNVSQEYVETGGKSGALTLGSIGDRAIEDLTKPAYAKISYTSQKATDKFFAEGMKQVSATAQMAKNQRMVAAVKIFGDNAANFVQPEGTLPFTPSISTAAGFVMSADAARGSTMMMAMQSGKMIDRLAKEQAARWSEILHPHVEAIRADPEALYIRNLVATKIRASAEDMVRLPEALHEGGVEKELILVPKSVVDDALPKAKGKVVEDPVGQVQAAIDKLGEQRIVRLDLDSLETKYLLERQKLTAEQSGKWNASFGARGKETKFNPDSFYEPPIDTARQPFFAMVQHNNPLEDIRPLSMVVASSAERLAAKIDQIKASSIGDQVGVYTKDMIKQNKQLEGVYDSGLLFSKTAVDSTLNKEGILSDYIPRRDDYIFAEQDAWIWKQAQAIHREGVEMMYGSELAELRFLERRWNADYGSRFGEDALETKAKNPYTQVGNTFLNLSNRSRYAEVWGSLNEVAQSGYALMTGAYDKALQDANVGKLSYEEASKIAISQGFLPAAKTISEEVFKETFKDNNSLSKLVSKINLVAGTLMIRMDFLNSAINVMSMPVLLAAESGAVRRDLIQKLGMDVTVPGTTHKIPSTMEMMMAATRSYWNKDKVPFGPGGSEITKHQYFLDTGAIRTDMQQVIDSVAIPPEAVKDAKGAVAYGENLLAKVGEFGAKVSGNNRAEDFVRYIAADVGLQLAKAQGITAQGELAAYVNLMVNRVHGNYLASQRPTIFSGPVGQAISLFQTYQFNMIQQMTRYLQEGNFKAVSTAAAMQNAIFGLQGNPLFWQLNQYIGNSNSKHRDLVTGVSDVIGTDGGMDDPARWALYGLGANMLQTNLYNRGDLTPRFTTIVPTSLQDIPAISIGTKALGSFLDSVRAISNGAPVADSILHGVAHAGFNRPLAGLASLVEGGKTTSQGTLLTTYNDLGTVGVASKLAGGEPLNNALFIDAYNRLQGYSSTQTKQIGEIAEAVKLSVNNNKELDPSRVDNFMNTYTAAGGDIKHFNRFMISATKNANQSVVNQMKAKIHNPLNQRQLGWLGADLPDSVNTSGNSAESQPPE